MGNSFVNLGAIYSLKEALNNRGEVFHFGGISSYLFSINSRPENTLPVGDVIESDYVVIAGMAMSNENFKTQEVVLKKFEKKGAKVIIAGGGGAKYDNVEVKKVREWMRKIPIYGFISRDEYSYQKYEDLATHSYDGIDSALFISDFFHPPELRISNFIVMNFDHSPEPKIRTDARLIIRTHHSCVPTKLRSEYVKYPNTLISDLPSDYLTLYAHAKITYSDRIHACLPTLSYGNQAMFFGKNSPRLRIFRRIGATEIVERPIEIDMKQISEEKKTQVKFLRSILV